MRTEHLRFLVPRTRRQELAEETAAQPPRPSPLPGLGRPFVASAVLLLAVLLPSLLLSQRSQGRALGARTDWSDQLDGSPGRTTPIVTSTIGSRWLDLIALHVAKDNWQMAFEDAQAALGEPGLSPEDRQALAGTAVTCGIEALFSQQLSPADAAGQRQTVTRYHTLKRLAASHGVALPYNPRQIAGRAYTSQAFLLAKVAFDEAVGQDQISLTDLDQLQFYTDTLYNLGWWWASRSQGHDQAEGLAYLVASYELDRHYELGRGHAQAVLRELIGPDESRWPPAAAVSFLSDDHQSSAPLAADAQ